MEGRSSPWPGRNYLRPQLIRSHPQRRQVLNSKEDYYQVTHLRNLGFGRGEKHISLGGIP